MHQNTVLSQRLPSLAIWLIGSQLLSSAATFMSLPFLSVYLYRNLHFSGTLIGAVLTSNLIATRLSPVLLGFVADRYGKRFFLLAGLGVKALGFFGLARSDSSGAVVAAAFAIGIGGGGYESGVYGTLASVPSHIKSKTFLLNNQALNCGVIVGPLLTAGLAAGSYNMAFWISGIVMGLISVGIFFVPKNYFLSPNIEKKKFFARTKFSREFIFLNISCVAWWFLFSQLYALLPLRFSSVSGGSGDERLIFILNGAVGLLVAAGLIKTIEKYSGKKIFIFSQIILLIAFTIPIVSESISFLVSMVIVYSVAETLALTGIDIEIARLAPSGSEASYFGFSNIPWLIGATIGNFAGGDMALHGGRYGPWAVLGCVAALGVVSACLYSACCPSSSNVREA